MSGSAWSVSMGAGRVALMLLFVLDVASVDKLNRVSRLMFGKSSRFVSSSVDSEFWLSIDPRAHCFFLLGNYGKSVRRPLVLCRGGVAVMDRLPVDDVWDIVLDASDGAFCYGSPRKELNSEPWL